MSDGLLSVYTDLHVKYPLLLSDVNKTWSFFDRFSKNTQISNYMKIRPVRAKLFHADGRMDGRTDRHDEANGLFSKFCE